MATSRMLAKSISVSSQVNSMSRFARLLFTWMIAHADDWGVMVGESRRVRALVLPMDDDATDAEVAEALDEMEAQELIWRYPDPRQGRTGTLLQFRTWETHQQGLHKRTAPKLPRYSDHFPADDESEGNFREVPGSSGKFRANVSERIRTERNTPTVSDEPSEPNADASEPPAGDFAPTARMNGHSSSSQYSQPTLPERRASDTTDRIYWTRILKEADDKHRLPLLVQLAHEKIGVPDGKGSAAYGRLGKLAKEHGAALLAGWILQAAAGHIDGDPLDYLTKIANGQAARASPNGRNGQNGHRPVTAATANRPIITVDDVYPD